MIPFEASSARMISVRSVSSKPQGLLLTHGRGLHLMKALMDEVSFEENGTVVRMRKQMKTRNRYKGQNRGAA
jgi:anti-sigma regulatory factor (Ser/Thr protein kinase)